MTIEDCLSLLLREVDKSGFWENPGNTLRDFCDQNDLEEKSCSESRERITYESNDGLIDLSIYSSHKGKIGWISFAISAVEDPDVFSPQAYSESIEILRRQFQTAFQKLKCNLGDPSFQTATCPQTLLEFFCAIEIAIWPLSHAVVVLKLEHQDSDVPIILDIGIWETLEMVDDV